MAQAETQPNLVYQRSHGFRPGQVLRIDKSTGKYALARADSEDNARVVAVVLSYYDQDRFSIVEYEIDTLSNLTRGAIYYLSAAVWGGVTIEAPAIVREIYQAATATTAILLGFGSNSVLESSSGSDINPADFATAEHNHDGQYVNLECAIIDEENGTFVFDFDVTPVQQVLEENCS